MDFDDVLKMLTLAGAAFGWVYQVRTRSRRDKIVTDLAIYERATALLGSGEHTERVRASLLRRMTDVYGRPGGVSGNIPWADLATLVFFGACGWWIGWDGYSQDRAWEVGVAVLFLLVAAGALMNVWEKLHSGDGGA